MCIRDSDNSTSKLSTIVQNEIGSKLVDQARELFDSALQNGLSEEDAAAIASGIVADFTSRSKTLCLLSQHHSQATGEMGKTQELAPTNAEHEEDLSTPRKVYMELQQTIKAGFPLTKWTAEDFHRVWDKTIFCIVAAKGCYIKDKA